MITSGRYLYAAFQAQQADENALKAVIQDPTRVPPRINDLEALAEHAGLGDPDLMKRVGVLNPYYVVALSTQARCFAGIAPMKTW